MEARFFSTALVVASILSLGASHRTQNFIVTASSQPLAREVCESAEAYRRDLAIEWLGKELPPWQGPCPITVQAGPHLGAGGATSFTFHGGRPTRWTMNIQGSRERLLDSVLPHEVTHTIFATHFGRPLPRWADEGACTTVEHISEKQKQHQLLYQFLTTGRGIAFNEMFAMKEYPPDILPLYSQGFSLARFLIAQGGHRKFVQYVGDGMKWNNWTAATQQYYGIPSLSDLQVTWLGWVRNGCPQLPSRDDTLVASQDSQPAARGPSQDRTQAQAAASPQGKFTWDVSPQAPPSTHFASASTNNESTEAGGSWYARQRDLARGGEHPSSAPTGMTGTAGQPVEPLTQQSTSVTRPQPIGRPEPTILAPPPAAGDQQRPSAYRQRSVPLADLPSASGGRY